MNVGNDSATTRIVRCYARGTISAVGTDSGWIYIGGIVGYNNFALVSQCWFDGTVEIDRGNDYTGGIAGHSNHSNSRVEDCWSSGTVKGNKNAGGIVGIYGAIGGGVYNCYSLSAITVNAGAGETGEASGQSAGGIVGQARSGGDITGTIALNPSIGAPNGFGRLGRVAGEADSYVSFSDNYARTDMSVTVSGAAPAEPFPDRVDGLDCAERPNQAFYEGLGWNFRDIWKMDASGGYPVLKWQH